MKMGVIHRETARYKQVIGTYKNKDGSKSMYQFTKYKFLLDAPFDVSDACCRIMKKAPVHTYSRKTGQKPMTAQMASESRLRTVQWLKNGCNGFHMSSPISNPMSFWTEQDVLLYIKQNNLQICSVYGDVVVDGEENSSDEISADAGIFDNDRPLLNTTGCKRTGCMFCGYGCHLEKSPGRFEMMRVTHPKQYGYIMKPKSEGGLGYREIIDWINEHGNMNIKY